MGWKTIQSPFWSGALVAAIAATAQSPAHEPAPLGKMVDLGGYRIHLYCTGKGKQTVILSPGGGDFSFAWYLVQQRLQSSTRVCSYDRAGSAWSDPGPQPLTLRQEAYELELALKLSGEKGPYILVGHSIGGLVVRTFAEGFRMRLPGWFSSMRLARTERWGITENWFVFVTLRNEQFRRFRR